MSDNFQNLIEEYTALANYIDGEEDRLRNYKKARDNLKCALMAKMNELGMTNAKSVTGASITIVNKAEASVVDAQALFDYVFQSGKTDLLTKRVSTDAVTGHLETYGELPPGINYSTVQTMRFNRK